MADSQWSGQRLFPTASINVHRQREGEIRLSMYLYVPVAQLYEDLKIRFS